MIFSEIIVIFELEEESDKSVSNGNNVSEKELDHKIVREIMNTI